jgi:hypothetical protein
MVPPFGNSAAWASKAKFGAKSAAPADPRTSRLVNFMICFPLFVLFMSSTLTDELSLGKRLLCANFPYFFEETGRFTISWSKIPPLLSCAQ